MKRFLYLLPALLLAASLSGCTDDDGPDGPDASHVDTDASDSLDASGDEGATYTSDMYTADDTGADADTTADMNIDIGPDTDPDTLAISGVSGTIGHGSTITIAGSGFGTKSTAEPIKWDDFENGASGASLTEGGWTDYSETAGPVYSTEQSYSGSQAGMRQTTSNEDFRGAYLKDLDAMELYVSMNFYWEKISGDYSASDPVVKMTRINCNPSPYRSTPTMAVQYRPRAEQYYFFMNNGVNGEGKQPNLSSKPIEGQWNRLEAYFKLSSTPGAADGMFSQHCNLVENHVTENFITRQDIPGADEKRISFVLLPMMVSNHDATARFKFFVDDVYVDRTRARVELGDAATWEDCTQREVQAATAWSNRSISVTVNKGAFADGQDLFLFVVDDNGNVSNGYPVTLGE